MDDWKLGLTSDSRSSAGLQKPRSECKIFHHNLHLFLNIRLLSTNAQSDEVFEQAASSIQSWPLTLVTKLYKYFSINLQNQKAYLHLRKISLQIYKNLS